MPAKVPYSTAPTAPFVRDCERCTHAQAPIVCKRCQCAAYCSADHQKADEQRHRKLCKPVADARKVLDQEEQNLLKEDPYSFDEADGSFYLIYETRPYVRAKYGYIRALSEFGSFLATEMALKEAKECLFLNEGDNLAVRDVVPSLLLLLGRMQEAYDYIRFWATFDDSEGGNENEDGGEDEDEGMEEEEAEEEEQQQETARGKKGKTLLTRKKITGVAPCFKTSGADMFESLDVFLKPQIDSVFHKCALAYIKMVIAHALTGAINKLSDPSTSEQEKTDVLTFLASNKLPSDLEGLRALQTTIELQAAQVVRLTHEKNHRFWGPLRNPTGKSIVRIGAPVNPDNYRFDSETSQWILPYSELWRAEGYMLQFISSTLYDDDD